MDKEVYERAMRETCGYCHKRRATELHHAIHGTKGNKRLSEKYADACLIPLCRECHYEVHHGTGIDLDHILKAQAQEDFELLYPDEDWLEIFGRNYK